MVKLFTLKWLNHSIVFLPLNKYVFKKTNKARKKLKLTNVVFGFIFKRFVFVLLLDIFCKLLFNLKKKNHKKVNNNKEFRKK